MRAPRRRPGASTRSPALLPTLLLTLALTGCVAPRNEYLLGERLPTLRDAPTSEADAVRAGARALDAEIGESAPAALVPIPASGPSPAPLARAAAAPVPASRGVWARLQSGNGIAPLPDALAGDLVREYASRPDFLSRAMQRSAPYLRHIVDQLDRQGLPAELALLPVIESGFDPRAVSPAAAGGIWQFIPETGRRYGLRQDWLRDERRDPLAATDAALAYLSDLHRRFGDWHLALAAYNCGEGCVSRAVDRARAAGLAPDFPGIRGWLPAETQAYVPRFVAVRTIFRDPQAFGVMLPPVDQAARIVRQPLDRDADLASLARVAGVPVDDLASLNAGVLRQVVTGDERFVWLAEPHAARLQAALKTPGAGALLQLKPVQARPQERLESFAARHNIDAARLRSINNIPASLSTIRAGTLFVPLDIGEAAPTALAIAALAPLRMQGEEQLAAQRLSITARDQELMAAHPAWVESGWVPGRLQLFPARRRAAR